MNKTEVHMLIKKVEQHLQGLDKNLKFSIKNTTYGENNLTFVVEGAKIGADGVVHTKMRGDFEKSASWYGLKSEDLDRCFDSNGITYKIVGLKASYRKYPIICQDINTGKQYKFKENVIQQKLEKEVAVGTQYKRG